MTPLSDLELDVMAAVWGLGRATVREVEERLRATRPLAYTTVATVLRRLEQKGYVAHQEVERTYVYQPLVEKKQVGGRLLCQLLRRVFDGSAERLMAHLLEQETLSSEELQRLRSLLDEKCGGTEP
jgi:predicted transcriptional regulator